ncbi:hypothetical protein J8273_6480 [Carpediemonas membranifera]|uniref:HTH myb-type domain-containing protein n=1 Tax=Carpediemonas membranifera TaxID=201153 RepID=A0A8J6DY77_9EUKA|nr:hypothetical protein J8273_6480 [Carpediemonas membranifera]|eukprot:KAG9391704.1 hypothetical protein J8273_6480 [Carpediemonas membranifera]
MQSNAAIMNTSTTVNANPQHLVTVAQLASVPRFPVWNSVPKDNLNRIEWKGELQDRFMTILLTLGVRSAQPKYILRLMNVNGLSRIHVASHLQKIRMKLCAQVGVAHINQLEDSHGEVLATHYYSKKQEEPYLNAEQPASARIAANGANLDTPTSHASTPAPRWSAIIGHFVRTVAPIIRDPDDPSRRHQRVYLLTNPTLVSSC